MKKGAIIRDPKFSLVSLFLIGLFCAALLVPAWAKSTSSDTSQTLESKEQTINSSDCNNYVEGKWIVDDKRPFYSGSGCKQWLSSMWACRLMQRTDFGYEKLRWQPKDCKIDQEFTGARFLEKVRDKTLAFVGDSLGREHFQSLMCMVTGGKQRSDVVDVGREYGLVKSPGAERPDGWAYRFPTSNTTLLFYWASTLSDLVPINGSDNIAMHIDRAPLFLRTFIHKFNLLVLNTGHHWNKGEYQLHRWIVYVNSIPNTNPKLADISGARNFTIHSIVRWVDSQMKLNRGLKAFFTTVSPMHIFDEASGTCKNNPAYSGDSLTAAAVTGTGVRLLDITGLSNLRPEGHISHYSLKGHPGGKDCLHWCLPGIPDTWNEILFTQI